jgi:hypothetical protein
MSITPNVAHKNTNKSTPMRRSQRRATEGEAVETAAGAGGSKVSVEDLISPTALALLAKGSLGSEIIACRFKQAESKAVEWAQFGIASRGRFRIH